MRAEGTLKRQEVALVREEDRQDAGFRQALHMLEGCSDLQGVTDSQDLQRCTATARAQYLVTFNATVAYISSKPAMRYTPTCQQSYNLVVVPMSLTFI